MLPIFNNIVSTIYGSNTSFSYGNGGGDYSLIGKTSSSIATNNSLYESRFETLEMYKFVRNFHLTKAILNLYTAFISDLYRDSTIAVTIKDHDDWQEWANICIAKTDLKKNILDNLEDFLFWGNYGKYLDHESAHFNQLIDPMGFSVYYERDVAKLAILEDTKKPIRYYNGLWLQYKPRTIKVFTTEDKRDNKDANFYFESDFRKGVSIFQGVILRLYSMFIKEYLADQMDLKEALKNETLVANVGDAYTDYKDIAQSVDMISNLVNDQESMSILSRSPEALLRLIDEKMVNYINVVPGIQNFTNFDKMELASMRDKINLLREGIDSDESKILKTLGIPDELMNNSATKWESIERSSRFATSVSYINSSISTGIQQFCQAQIYYKYGKLVPLSEISLNTDSASILSSSDNSFKYDNIQRSIEAIRNIADSYKDLSSNDMINKDELYTYMTKKLSSVDANLISLIRKEPNEESEEDSQ